MNDIENRIIQVLSEIKKKDYSGVLNRQSNIIEEVNLDSLEIISFILEIEEAFNIEMDFETFGLDHLASVSRFAGFIAAQSEEL